jgi:protease I
MDIAEKKVAILVDNYFEEAEFTEPLKALKNAAVEVAVIGVSSKSLQAMKHAELSGTYQADVLLKEAQAEDYDALVLPGGAMNADTLRMDQTAREWVKYFLAQGKPLAVICHAPWVLVSADCVNGRNVTSFWTIQDDIRNAGGKWQDSSVVIDETLITSRKPDDLPEFCEALLSMLQSQHNEQLNKEVYND